MDAVPFVISKRVPGSKSPSNSTTCCVCCASSCSGAKGDSIILAEANVLPETDMEYFGKDGDRMHMMFNFQVNQNLFYALAAADCRPLVKHSRPRNTARDRTMGSILAQSRRAGSRPLDEDQRQRVFECFGPEEEMQLYKRGIRRRLAPMLNGDRRRIELAYSLMFTLPGTPVMRYGDEIGMGDDLKLPERNCARTPMQWSTEPHAGFTKSNKPILPVINNGPYSYQARKCRRAAARSEFVAELD